MQAGKSQFSPSGKRSKEEAERLFYEVANPDALPKSLQRNQWTLDRLKSRLVEKLEARASKGSSSFRVAFMQFTRDPASNGVTYENFHEDLRSKFGFVVSREDSRSLYDKCDADGKGFFTFSDFARTMFPNDYTQPLWNVRSEDQRSTLLESRKTELKESLKLLTPREEKASGKTRPPRPLRELEEIIQDKIMFHTSKQADQFRQAFRLFSDERGNRNGFTREAFKMNLRKKFGIDITAEEVNLLFEAYDADKSGTIDFHEFVTGVLPSDYTATPWNITSEDRTMAAIAKEKAAGQEVFVLKEYPKAWSQNKWTLEQVEQRMRDKITAHTSRSTDQFRQAFCLFRDGHGSDLTKDRLKYQLSEKFGIVVTDKEVDALFLKYDTDGSGTIDFYEFVSGLMPPDYSRKNWSIASEEQAQERQTESKRFYKSVARPMAYGSDHQRTAQSILQLVATKISQHTPGDATAASAKRLIFRWFQQPQVRVRTHGSARTTSKVFRAGINNLHFLLTSEEMETLESRYRIEGEADALDIGKFAEEVAGLFEGQKFAGVTDQTNLLFSPSVKNSRPTKPWIAMQANKFKSLPELTGFGPESGRPLVSRQGGARAATPAGSRPPRSHRSATKGAAAGETAATGALATAAPTLGSSRSSTALPRAVGSRSSRVSASPMQLPRVGAAKYTPRQTPTRDLLRTSSRMRRSESTPTL